MPGEKTRVKTPRSPRPDDPSEVDRTWVAIERTVNLAPYESLKVAVGATVSLEPGESVTDAIRRVAKDVRQEHADMLEVVREEQKV